jgi:hypothetical protein
VALHVRFENKNIFFYLKKQNILAYNNAAVGGENSEIVGLCLRVARWYIFKPKNPIWVNFV